MSETGVVFNQMNLVVRDMQATLSFYRNVGLSIPEDAGQNSGGMHVEVEMPGGIHLDFDSYELARAYHEGFSVPSGAGCRGVLGFSVATRDAVDSRYAALTTAGHPGLQPPYDTFWGARYAVVEDPDGNHVGLMSPIDPTRRTAPPGL